MTLNTYLQAFWAARPRARWRCRHRGQARRAERRRQASHRQAVQQKVRKKAEDKKVHSSKSPKAQKVTKLDKVWWQKVIQQVYCLKIKTNTKVRHWLQNFLKELYTVQDNEVEKNTSSRLERILPPRSRKNSSTQGPLEHKHPRSLRKQAPKDRKNTPKALKNTGTQGP